jgi:type II secretory ATPase GspE/PulE/Tfp pilus assembly ATPase PilB-like protein
VQLVNKMINTAIKKRASDVHVEPNVTTKCVDVRFRIDGECIPYQSFPYSHRWAILSRLKIMANLDITEKRLPQDGKIIFRSEEPREEIELRMATLPTHGRVEDVVMRILTKGKIMTLEEINLTPTNHKKFIDILKNPYGLILVVGPTGSGKTTTLHAALHHLNKPNSKIWTAEDPVEITQVGLRQVQINRKIGLDFSQTMRAFLRADPDIIMIGEMRDYETAKISIEASSTGHLVLSTLHTNSAPETIVRLLDIGVDPFNFADSLLCVLAQRLIRKLCNSCKSKYHPTEEEFHGLVNFYGEKLFPELNVTYDKDFKLYKAEGCSDCSNTGYYGRTGIFELLAVTENIKYNIGSKKSSSVIRKAAMAEGMRTLLQDGIVKVMNGETDAAEVHSVCMR